MNFLEGKGDIQYFESTEFKVSEQHVQPMNIVQQLSAASTNPLFLFLGVRFYTIGGIQLYPMKKAPNVVNIVVISNP